MQGADWPRMARRLVGLQQAGVDLGTFLPQMGRMTVGVHQAVTANTARIKAEGTDRWADLLKTTMPESLVRDAILAAWPDIAAAMGRLDTAGIDVARILTDAHLAGVGVDQAVVAVTAAAAKTPAPAPAAISPPAPAPAPAAAVGVARDAPATPRAQPSTHAGARGRGPSRGLLTRRGRIAGRCQSYDSAFRGGGQGSQQLKKASTIALKAPRGPPVSRPMGWASGCRAGGLFR